MTMTCDVKIYVIMCEPHFVKLFFVNILHSTAVFDFLTSEILPLVIMRVPGLVGVDGTCVCNIFNTAWIRL